jgi:hypothetical protein
MQTTLTAYPSIVQHLQVTKIPVLCYDIGNVFSRKLVGSEGFIVSPPSTKIVLLILHIEFAGGVLSGVMVLAKSRHVF